MSNLSIKDVPEAWAESLRQRAARNHRSLQGELMAIIEQVVASGADSLKPESDLNRNPARKGRIVGYDRMGHPIMRFGWQTLEQISADIAAQPQATRPVYPPGIALSVDMIRAERDAR